MMAQYQNRVAVATTQKPIEPDQSTPKVEPFGLRAAWLHFASEVELQRLAKIHVRLELRKRGIADLVSDRQKIMNRCIRRMRRADGKN